ncbi:geranylgeranyl pyrophosphate synthase [Streptomyces venezuelae]|nr:hypothetical protein [Streptomyces gardneri]ALO06663.1 geranylgeranyl pyrophosphate synthase [Streptomyces venezuelae]QPK44071.1 hypothetical protein H4W23_05230 [Streptomyces gardneri]WRK35345.1 hypothetical protein U0M97_05255 [Streptomyces venezuelae]CUM43053.1 hypothetical protein BN2537_15071 [Streptomyces venezuelae]
MHAEVEARIDRLVERARAALAGADLPPERRQELATVASLVAYREAVSA